MKREKYQLESDANLFVFEFISIGPKGKILKLVHYSETNLKGYYSIGFGDKDEVTGKINDTSITNNGDSQKVLATVVSSLYAFTERHPDARIYAEGSTDGRTRLYRIGITKNLSDIKKDFYLFCFDGSQWLEFEEGIKCQAFLIQRKIITFVK